MQSSFPFGYDSHMPPSALLPGAVLRTTAVTMTDHNSVPMTEIEVNCTQELLRFLFHTE